MSAIRIVAVGDRTDLVEAAVDMTWAEWGADLPSEERQRWVAVTRGDANRRGVPTGFFALDQADQLIGTVGLHHYDIASRRDRFPWLCGLLVRAGFRGGETGQHLVRRIEAHAAANGIPQIWVFTEQAARFYRSCGWIEVERLAEEPDHGPGTVLCRSVRESSSSCPRQRVWTGSAILEPLTV